MQVDKKIVWIFNPFHRDQVNAGVIKLNMIIRDRFAVYHELKFRVLHAGPPVWRLHPFYLCADVQAEKKRDQDGQSFFQVVHGLVFVCREITNIQYSKFLYNIN